MAASKTLFIFTLILQTGLAGTIAAVLSKEGAYLSMGILSALVFLSLLIALMIFWSKKLKYLYMYIITTVLWLALIVFLFLDIFGIFHILESLDNLIIGKTAINNYKTNTKAIPSLQFFLFIGLMVFMVLSAILACFVPLKQNVKQTDEYGNVYRGSKTVSVINNTMKKTRFASEVITINNSEHSMDGDPGITIIPNNNNYYGGSLNNFDMLPTDEAPFLNKPNMDSNADYNSLRRMNNNTNMTNTRYDNDYYSRDNISPREYDYDDSVKYNTLSSAKPKSPISPLKKYDDSQRSSTFDRSYASKRGQEARENTERERNRERIRERERERLRERNRRDRERRDRERRDRRDKDRRDRDRNNYDDDEVEEKELHPGNISSREELETYLNKSSMEISKSMSMVGNPKFVSMFEIEENASDASENEEDDFTMNHFTIKCKICKKDIPIEEVENHKCESANIPLINVETEEHKKAMEEKARKEKEEKERLEREKKEKEEKERLEREKEEEEKRAEREKRRRQRDRERERDRTRDRERRRDERSKDRDRRRDERSRDRDRDRRRDERSRDRDRDRKRRDKEAEWEQRYNTKDNHKSERERDRSRRRKDDNEIREGGRYEITQEYEQVLNDEVTVKHGHVFEVEKVFEDGWCVGTNLSTNKWGAIPMSCLNSRQERRRRIQSLYMA